MYRSVKWLNFIVKTVLKTFSNCAIRGTAKLFLISAFFFLINNLICKISENERKSHKDVVWCENTKYSVYWKKSKERWACVIYLLFEDRKTYRFTSRSIVYFLLSQIALLNAILWQPTRREGQEAALSYVILMTSKTKRDKYSYCDATPPVWCWLTFTIVCYIINNKSPLQSRSSAVMKTESQMKEFKNASCFRLSPPFLMFHNLLMAAYWSPEWCVIVG